MPKLHWSLAGLALFAGILDCWLNCYAPNNDGIHYLNIGESLLRGDGAQFFNQTWGPLYGTICVLWLKILQVDRIHYREALKLLNLVLLPAAIFCFAQIIKRVPQQDSIKYTLIFCYSALLICLRLLGVFRETPDLALLVVLLASAVCYLRLYEKPSISPALVSLGLLGAAGVLFKQAYLPIALVFIALAGLSPVSFRRRLLLIASTGVAFLVLWLPWVTGLSLATNRATLGGNGKLNYLLHVEKRNFLSLLEVPGGSYALTVNGQIRGVDAGSTFPLSNYPLHFDPAAFIRDVPIELNPQLQAAALKRNLILTLNLFRHKGPFALAAGIAFLAFLQRRTLWRFSPWIGLIGVAIVPFLVYPLVHIEYRYFAPYLLLGSVAAWAFLLEKPLAASPRLLAIPCLLAIAGFTWDAVVDFKPDRAGTVDFACCTNPYVDFANELQAAGVKPGSKVALIGEPAPQHFYAWLQPSNLRLQAIVDASFQTLSLDERKDVERELARRGILVLIDGNGTGYEQASTWPATRLGYRFHLLSAEGSR